MTTARVTPQWLAQQVAKATAPVVKRPAATRKEREIQKAILDAARYWKGVTLWRCNSGAVKDGTRFIRFGAAGMSDLIGWRVIQRWVPAGMQNSTMHYNLASAACFVALEVKRPNTFPTQAQQAFLDAVREAGGIAAVVRSVEDARKALGL